MHPTGSAARGYHKMFRSSQHCKGGAGGAWDVENRQLRSISGASMRDPNFWKGTFFRDIECNRSIFPLCKSMIFRFQQWEIQNFDFSYFEVRTCPDQYYI